MPEMRAVGMRSKPPAPQEYSSVVLRTSNSGQERQRPCRCHVHQADPKTTALHGTGVDKNQGFWTVSHGPAAERGFVPSSTAGAGYHGGRVLRHGRVGRRWCGK